MSLKIRLDQLASGPVTEEQKLNTDWCVERLGAEYSAPEPFSVAIRARKTADVVEATCSVRGSYKLNCSRCSDGLTLEFDVEFTHRFVPSGSLDTGDDEVDALFIDDPDISAHDGLEIDLTPVCIEHAILEIPYAPSCVDTATGPCEKWSEAPAQFGDVMPDDPEEKNPWAALKDLQLAGSTKPDSEQPN